MARLRNTHLRNILVTALVVFAMELLIPQTTYAQVRGWICDSSRLCYTSNKVGVGTSSVEWYEKFRVEGGWSAFHPVEGSGMLKIGGNPTEADRVYLEGFNNDETGSADIYLTGKLAAPTDVYVHGNLSTTGNVGIGTDVPQAALDINGELVTSGGIKAGGVGSGIKWVEYVGTLCNTDECRTWIRLDYLGINDRSQILGVTASMHSAAAEEYHDRIWFTSTNKEMRGGLHESWPGHTFAIYAIDNLHYDILYVEPGWHQYGQDFRLLVFYRD
jgi:hypothetical protein